MPNSNSATIEIDEKIYRKNVGIAIFNNAGKFFFAERADIKNAWQFPQGGADIDEDLLAAARREMLEETTIDRADVELMAIHKDWLTYNFPKQHKNDTAVGQAQKWFLFKYKGDDKNIKLEKASHQEFSQWRWATEAEVLAEIADFRKEVYKDMLAYFGRHTTHDKRI